MSGESNTATTETSTETADFCSRFLWGRGFLARHELAALGISGVMTLRVFSAVLSPVFRTGSHDLKTRSHWARWRKCRQSGQAGLVLGVLVFFVVAACLQGFAGLVICHCGR